MNRRTWIQSAVLSALATFTGLSATAAPDASPTQREIRVGETRKYDNGMSVKFLRVKRDNRCPLGDVCKKPGDATVMLRVRVAKKTAKIYELHTNRGNKDLWILLDAKDKKGRRYYRISINSLSPLPFEGKITPPENFRLDLKVDLKY